MTVYERIKGRINTNGLTELEIARLLYLVLSKEVSFSTKFNNTTDLEFGKMYSEKVDIDKFNGTEINCKMWSQLYSQLLDRYGIKNEIINQGHAFVVFTVDGYEWVADATTGTYTDLSRIHNGDDTINFGLCQKFGKKYDNHPLYDENVFREIKRIDEKIGYIDDKHKKTEELKELLSSIKNGSLDINSCFLNPEETGPIEKKIQLIFAKLGVLDFGFYETKDFIRNLEYEVLTSEEIENIKGAELKRTNGDRTVSIVQVITLFENNKYHYYLVAPNLPIKEVSKSDIVQFAVYGFGKEEESTIPGIIYPKNFKPGVTSNRLKEILNKFKLKDNIYEYASMRPRKVY